MSSKSLLLCWKIMAKCGLALYLESASSISVTSLFTSCSLWCHVKCIPIYVPPFIWLMGISSAAIMRHWQFLIRCLNFQLISHTSFHASIALSIGTKYSVLSSFPALVGALPGRKKNVFSFQLPSPGVIRLVGSLPGLVAIYFVIWGAPRKSCCFSGMGSFF